LFRTDKPFRKILARLIAPNGDNQQLEFLGDGQQLVVRRIHPDTHLPYRWHGGRPGGVRRSELPEIVEKEAQALVDDAAALLIHDHGYRTSEALKKRTGPDNRPRVDWSAAPISEVSSLRNVTATSVIGHLLRRNVDIDLACLLVRAWNEQCCKPPLYDQPARNRRALCSRRHRDHRPAVVRSTTINAATGGWRSFLRRASMASSSTTTSPRMRLSHTLAVPLPRSRRR
jgi:hypothetical protein